MKLCLAFVGIIKAEPALLMEGFPTRTGEYSVPDAITNQPSCAYL